MSKKLEALVATLEKKDTEHVAVIHDNGPAGVNTVALVDVKSDLSDTAKLEKAFMLTNSIEDAWWNNPKISKLFDGDGCRSTMVGDMILVGTEKYKVEPMGWSKI
ncbi:MAG TPA: hypothetical protein EYQ21_00045 [Flavobacteriales bacterium]|jgi:hypothetical protein|nr:hypothetical protein [Flavobacteriales bacterium]